MKVRKNKSYVYKPCLGDMCSPTTTAIRNLASGSVVTVVHPHGCPPPNTMGMCHIADGEGRFLGLVYTASLH